MLFALGAASSALNAIQSLTSSSSTSTKPTDSGNSPFGIPSSASESASAAPANGPGATSQLSPITMNALLAAQSQSSTGSAKPGTTSSSATRSSYDLLEQAAQRPANSVSLSANVVSLNA